LARRLQQAAEVCAFGWRIKDGWVLGWFYLHDFVFFCYQSEFRHAIWAGVVGLSWDYACVCYDGWLVEYFFASFVGTLQLVLVVSEWKLHVNRLLAHYTSSIAIFNKLYHMMPRDEQQNNTTTLTQETVFLQ
jgi:hypothetical protein